MRRCALLSVLVFTGCSLARQGIGAGVEGTIDAGERDATPLTTDDAGTEPVDAMAVALDAASDAGPADAGCAEETCNAADDDCDGEVDEGEACGCERVVRDRSIYLACTEFRGTFDEARAWCGERGYDLAELVAPDEHDAIDALVGGGELWIGLTDRLTEGTFVWNDGSALTYERWATLEPNDFFGEDCVLVRGDGGKWNDADCDEDHAMFCEAALSP